MTRSDFRSAGLCLSLAGAVCVVLVAAGPAAGQDNGRAIYNEQLRVQLDRQTPEAQELGFDAGGWFDFALFKYDDTAAGKWRTLRQYQLRAWARLNVRGVHRFYVRGMGGYDDWNSGMNPSVNRNDDLIEPKIERAWYELDLGQLHRNRTGQDPPVGFRMSVGRRFVQFGTALVLSMPMDMIEFEVTPGDWEFRALLGNTIRSSPNIDDSAGIDGHQRRCFWGLQLRYLGLSHHRPFVYFLNNHDRTDPKPRVAWQRFEYSSRYLGAGSTGTLVLPDLRYLVEVVGEWGRTYSEDATTTRDGICALAVNAQLEYFFQTRMRPKVSVEYLFGTGDDDRRTSATATIGGNAAGTMDRAFNAFGFRDTGIALAPRMANLHIYNVGASFFPLENFELFRNMEVGTKVFFYHKASGGGPISDTTATQPNQWVGWEWDVFCNWRVTSDLAWTIRYGAFMPGEAFPDRSCRQFLYTGVTLTF